MNELMLKLYVEALKYADSVVPVQHRYNDIYYSIAAGKHAELIVRKCASIAGKAEYSDTWLEPVEDAIKKHFGVEE
jgi:hypothetical protein